MTTKIDLEMHRGDRDTRGFVISNTAVSPAIPIDITGAILGLAVKKFETVTDEAATVLLRSYDPTEILITDALAGEGVWDMLPFKTWRGPAGVFRWDFEVNRPRESLTVAGTISVTAGSRVIVGDTLELAAIREKDILVPAGGLAGNAKPITITAVGGQGAADDPGAGNLLTDYDGFSTEAGVALEIFRGDVQTSAYGKFTIKADQKR